MPGRDIALALWIVFIWSVNLIIQKIAVGYLSVFVLSFLRVVLVFPLLLLYPKPQTNLWKCFVCGFFLSALYLILFGFGLQTDVGAGLSAFFIQMQVFFGILCCFLILGEKPTWEQIIGICISFVGVYFLKASSSSAELPFWGIILLIGSCLSYGIGIAFSKKYKVGGNMADVTWMSVTSAIPLFMTCLVFEGPVQTFEIIVNISPMVLSCILFATYASTIWGTYLWLSLIQRTVTASSVISFMLLLPVFSNILSNIILGETLSLFQMLSGFIIILGVMFAQGLHQRVFLYLRRIRKKTIKNIVS